MAATGEIEVDGCAVRVTNLDKVLYPLTGFTKAQVIDYYLRIADTLLPHLRNRPVTLKRYPDGAGGEFFYEKQAPKHRPEWVKTAAVWSNTRDTEIDYVLLNDRAALAWVANLASLELHPFLHRAPALTRPESVVFDLDPGAPADMVACCEVAMELQRLLAKLNLESVAKSSGSKGLQVFVPLNTRVTYAATKHFAAAVAERLHEALPSLVITQMKRSLRARKVFIDWSQNDEHKTTVGVYSLRAKDEPTVSTPVTWSEVATCARTKKADRLVFTPEEVLSRVRRKGDLFAPLLTLKQKLPRKV